MAITGLALVVFVIVHMLGNLAVFAGQDAMNSYAAFLKSNLGVLWGARIGLLVVFLTHVSVALQLARANSAARPSEYRARNTVQATLSSRYMVLTGSLILLFVVTHLMHFTLGIVVLPENFSLVDSQGRHDVYNMVVRGFQNTYVSSGYIFAMLLLLSHLSHGISSMFQTLGLSHPRYKGLAQKLGPALALVIVGGFVSIPIAVLLNIVTVSA